MKYGLMIVGAAAAALFTSACGSGKIELDIPTTTSSGAGGKGGAGQGGEGQGGMGQGGEGQGGKGGEGQGGMGQGGEGGMGMGGAGGAGGGGQGGAGGAVNCVKCSAVLLNGADPADLCPGKSQKLADDLAKCTCVDKCAMQCAMSCSGGQAPSLACQSCVQASCSAEG